MVEEALQIGQRWVERLFEQIRQEYQTRVPIAQWAWAEVWDAYLLWFQLPDTDRKHWIPCEQQGFARAYIEYAGDPDPVNDELRDYIEGCIRSQYESLTEQAATWAYPMG